MKTTDQKDNVPKETDKPLSDVTQKSPAMAPEEAKTSTPNAEEPKETDKPAVAPSPQSVGRRVQKAQHKNIGGGFHN